jgi:DNA processing protein
MRQQRLDLLALCLVKGLSWYLVARESLRPDGLTALVAGRITEQSREASEAHALLATAASKLDDHRVEAERLVATAEAEGVHLTTVIDTDYPLNLRTIYNLPPFLFYRGRLDADQDARSVAAVGTRDPSPAGLMRAREIARMLCERGVTVLSGLARGIDTAAHTAALEAGGRTVAVLGTGIGRTYPPESRDLAERIVAGGGALVSQFWPDAPPTTYSFPRRNITMSGMGQGTVVIEATATSGAKLQARYALDHGRKVFLLAELVTRQPWARTFLGRGAIEVQRVEDILTKLRAPIEIRARSAKADQLDLLNA